MGVGATKREVAEKLGVAKQTVVNYIAKLDLQDHVNRVGKADYLDEFAVSAIADAIGKEIPARIAPIEDGVTTSDAVIAALNDRIADLKAQNERLAAELSELRLARDREVSDLREQLADANKRASSLADRVAGIAERQQAIAAMPWWKRGSIALKLLGSGEQYR